MIADVALDQAETNHFILPPGSCDTHCHIFGPRERFPYSPARKYEPVDSPRETLAALHERLGVDRAVLVQASAYGSDNRALLDALAWRPGKWRGIAVIDDATTDQSLEQMAEAGVRGVRFNFVQSLGGYPDPHLFARTLSRIAPLGWHVVLHMMGEDILQLADTINRIAVPFVIDHMGRVDVAAGVEQPAFTTLIELAQREGAWVKLSGAERMASRPYDAAVPFARRLAEVRPDRILWGTDFPHPNLRVEVDERELVDLIPAYVADAAVQKRMLVDNPARLYGFSSAGQD